jgi:hypothetical protein
MKNKYGFTKDCVPQLWGKHGLFFRKIDCDNGYAVSVVCHEGSYGSYQGLFEVAIMRADDNEIVYDTPITGDVLGHLDFAEVAEVIEKVRALPKRDWELQPPKRFNGNFSEEVIEQRFGHP